MPASLSVQQLRDVLSDPSIYPHDPEAVHIEQTHISIVAVVPPWVYKFKKPVDLDFLDFSSLEKRRHYCHEEVRLNRRLCPKMYEGVVPLVRTDDGLRVNPPRPTGDILDYAVKMKFVEPEKTLEARVERDEADPSHVDRIARRLCAFYRETRATPETAEAGWIDNLRVNIDENFEQTEAHVGSVFTRPAFNALRYYFNRVLDQRAPLLHRRRANGYVIEGHGDLRLDHAHLTEDHVCILDCIEFNERFRYLDIANDVAFLAMDLDVCGRPDLARRFVNQMADGLDDPELRTLQPFYRAYRAHVRAKVEAIRAAEAEVSSADRRESRRLAGLHAHWALRYAVSGGRPFVLVVMGPPATGKSTQAASVADAFGWEHVASDRIRKRIAGVPRDVRADPATREQIYTEKMTDDTYESLQNRALERGRHGASTVLDATYSSPERRERLRIALRRADLPYAVVELTASEGALRKRLAARSEEAPTGSDARLEDADDLMERYRAPHALEDPHHVRISTEQSPEDTTQQMLEVLIRLHDPAS